ncbi:STE like transcription factor-domain-containing protein [Fennellomyces sp. T-0311]|nr:STE like transcription factor-domain-containing protein [Fennellomyces sp. T-0311]
MANVTMPTASGGRNTSSNNDTAMMSLPRPTNDDTQERLNQIDDLKYFLATATNDWDPERSVKSFALPTGESVSCVFWNHLFHITGTDIVRCLVFRFHAFGRPVCNLKKFEEGVFSDLRNLKPGNDACLEEPKSEFLDMLYKNNCIRTQKKQKVFYWFSVPHDRLFLDALERDLKREKIGNEPTSMAVAEPASSLSLDSTHELFDQLRKSMALSAAATAHALEDEAVVSSGRSDHRHPILSNADETEDMMTDDDEWTTMAWTPSTSAAPERTWQPMYRSQQRSNLSDEPVEPISNAIGSLDLAEDDTSKQLLRRKSKALFGMVSLFEGSATYKQRRRRAASLSSTSTSSSIVTPHQTSTSSGGPIRHHHRSTSNPDLTLMQQQLFVPTSSTSSPLIQKTAPPLLSTTSYNALASATNALASLGDDGSDPNRTYTCPLGSCGRLFKRLEHLKRHLRTHTMERPYLCQQCGKRFSRSDNLAQHRKTHDRSRLNQSKKDDHQDGAGSSGGGSGNTNARSSHPGSGYTHGGSTAQQQQQQGGPGTGHFPPHQQWMPHLAVPSTTSNSLCSSRSSTMSPMHDPDWDFHSKPVKQEPLADWSASSSPNWQQPMVPYEHSKLAMMHLQQQKVQPPLNEHYSTGYYAFPPEDTSSLLESDYNSTDFAEFYTAHAPLIPTTFVNDYLVDQV